MGDMKLSERVNAWATILKTYTINGELARYVADIVLLEQALEEARAGRDRALADRIPFAEAYAAPIARERDALRTECNERALQHDDEAATISILRAELAQVRAERDAARLAALRECVTLCERYDYVPSAADDIQALVDAEQAKGSKP